MKKTHASAVIALAATAALVTGCATGGGDDGGSEEIRDSVTIGLNVALASLQPMSAFSREEQVVIGNIFDTLVEYQDGEYVPSLAESYEISDDQLTYTFHLRDDVTFHNGEKLTADDVKYTFDSMPDFPFWKENSSYIASSEVIDEYTVAVHTTAATAYNLVVLSGTEVINEEAIEEHGADEQFFPVGTGPYQFVSYDGTGTIELERYDDYFGWADGEPAPIKTATYKVFADEESMSLALAAGELDLVAKLNASSALQFEDNPDFTVDYVDSDSVYLALMNTDVAPFDDPLVRQAVAYGIDREGVNALVSEGKDVPWDHFYSEKAAGAPDYEALPHYEYDVDKAKELLAEAGYPDGITLTSPVPTMVGLDGYAVAIQQQLAEIGIDFEIETFEQNALYDKIFAMDYQLLPFALSTEIYDMSYPARFFMSPAADSMPFPTGSFGTPELDDLLNRAAASTDLDERRELYTEAYTDLFDLQPIVSVLSQQTAIVKKADLDYSTPEVLKVELKNLSWN
ncbi:ABC transporter substrate-binding protein [Microbacterium sp. SSM24]|uniref:ABC transporter substrate-binding protein n=1 Tax=Microbacterium sp. SSM24 TaxID=2991714 RepID=UPI0022268E94|nr:ABC transporter substrate-binding protein [Microbacterium sp. SSM24]MCW3492614.1 ABC transporter substrate-binding protein [Microbacterium sp. SSM24]